MASPQSRVTPLLNPQHFSSSVDGCVWAPSQWNPLWFSFLQEPDRKQEKRMGRRPSCWAPAGRSQGFLTVPLHSYPWPFGAIQSPWGRALWKLWFPLLTGSRKGRKLQANLCSGSTGRWLTKGAQDRVCSGNIDKVREGMRRERKPPPHTSPVGWGVWVLLKSGSNRLLKYILSHCRIAPRDEFWGFPYRLQWLRLCFPMQGVWVQSLVGELRCLVAKTPKYKTEANCNKFNKDFKKMIHIQKKKKKKS